MQEVTVYRLIVRGQLDEESINASSPIQIVVEKTYPAGTQFSFVADQTGFVGLIRFLHQHGFIILDVKREEKNPSKEE